MPLNKEEFIEVELGHSHVINIFEDNSMSSDKSFLASTTNVGPPCIPLHLPIAASPFPAGTRSEYPPGPIISEEDISVEFSDAMEELFKAKWNYEERSWDGGPNIGDYKQKKSVRKNIKKR